MLHKYFEGKIPAGDEVYLQHEIFVRSFGLLDTVSEAMEGYDPRRALDLIFEVVKRANQFVEEQKPWVLAKDPARKSELAKTMFVLTECMAHVAYLLQPFLPQTAKRIIERLGAEEKIKKIRFTRADFSQPLVPAGKVIERGEALFPKLEEIPDAAS